MRTGQQAEALRYFRLHAEEWRRKAEGKHPKVNVIAERNRYVLEVIRQRVHTRALLDVGCGTGELVCAVAEQGIQSAVRSISLDRSVLPPTTG